MFDISVHAVDQAPVDCILCASLCSPKNSTVIDGVLEDTGVTQLRYVSSHSDITGSFIAKQEPYHLITFINHYYYLTLD